MTASGWGWSEFKGWQERKKGLMINSVVIAGGHKGSKW